MYVLDWTSAGGFYWTRNVYIGDFSEAEGRFIMVEKTRQPVL